MHNKLLKVAALALVLVFGSLGQMAWASAGNQPSSFSYPVEMAIRNMSLTRTANEITESKPQMEFAQDQVDEMQRLTSDSWEDACLGDACDLTRDQDRDRDGTCDGDDCDPARDQDRDRDGTCDGDDCDPARDQDRDRDGTPSPVGTGEGRGGGHSGGQGGGGHH